MSEAVLRSVPVIFLYDWKKKKPRKLFWLFYSLRHYHSSNQNTWLVTSINPTTLCCNWTTLSWGLANSGFRLGQALCSLSATLCGAAKLRASVTNQKRYACSKKEKGSPTRATDPFMKLSWCFSLVHLERLPKYWSKCLDFTNPKLPADNKNAPRWIMLKVWAHTSHKTTSALYISMTTKVAVPLQAEVTYASIPISLRTRAQSAERVTRWHFYNC